MSTSRLQPVSCEEIRCVVRFLRAESKTPAEIVQHINAVYGNKTANIREIFELCEEFERGSKIGYSTKEWKHAEHSHIRCQMGHVIITALSLLWVLLTIVSTLAVFSAVLTPKWLLGPTLLEVENGTLVPSVGIFNRCTRIKGQSNCAVFAMNGLATDSSVFPSFWKVSLVMFTMGLAIMVVSTMAALLSCCVHSINRKSIFTVTGTVQASAGLFYLLGLVLYAAGWGSSRVSKLCGQDAGPFTIGDCSFGWAMYMGIAGICLTFLTSCLSVCAEKTTSSDKVSRKVERGQTLVCLL